MPAYWETMLKSYLIQTSSLLQLGIVLGVLFGKLNITFPGGLSFSPGLTGGILIVALFLSAIGKTGPILWSMSGPANQLLRQLGLLLFLAEVGTSAGTNLVATFQESGWLLFGVGAAITLVPMLVAVFVGLFVFKINMLDLLGTITGGMTSTPGLAAADSMTDSNIPSVAYATASVSYVCLMLWNRFQMHRPYLRLAVFFQLFQRHADAVRRFYNFRSDFRCFLIDRHLIKQIGNRAVLFPQSASF